MNDIENLCSTIEKRPDNKALGQLTDILNRNENIDHEKILKQCGKYLSGINLEELFQFIYRNNHKHLIEIYLRNVEDISEKQLIQSLNVTFDYLEIVLSKPYDYWSLTNSMKLYFDSTKSVELADQLVLLIIQFHPSVSAITDWLCALIDAHFSSFVLAKWNKLELIEKFVQDRLTTFDLLQGLNTIKKASTTIVTNKKNHDNLYVLQRIHFK